MSDISRDNPYGQDPDMISGADPRTVSVPTQVISDSPEPQLGQQSNGVIQMPEQTVQGSPPVPPVTPPVINSAGAIDQVPTSPLSNQQFATRSLEALEEKKTLDAAQAAQLGAGKQDMENQRAKVNLDAATFDAMKAQENKAMLDKAMQDATTRDMALRKQIAAAQKETVDPSRWWNNKSTEGKILGGIGIFLGGVAGGLNGTGRNTAIEVMNKAIDDDMNSQRHHIENNWKAIADTHELNSDAFNRDLHRQTWENNYRTSALERVKLQLAAIKDATISPTTKYNADVGILALSHEQDTIRNNVWKAGVAAQQAEVARVRGLMKSANEDVMKLIEKEGVSPDEAEKRVYGSPMFRELIASGRVPQSIIAEQQLHKQFIDEVDATAKATGMSREEAAKSIITDPRYEVLTKGHDPLVPNTKGAEAPKDLEARMVDVQVAPGKTVRMPAASKEEANVYREKTGGAQQWDAGVAKLQALNDKSKKGALSTAEIAEWNQIRNDMIATYGVMKEGSKRLPNETEAKRLHDEVIGNPPIGFGVGSAINPSSLPGTVDARLKGLAGISDESRKAANLALTNKPQVESSSGKKAEGPKGPAKGLKE